MDLLGMGAGSIKASCELRWDLKAGLGLSCGGGSESQNGIPEDIPVQELAVDASVTVSALAFRRIRDRPWHGHGALGYRAASGGGR